MRSQVAAWRFGRDFGDKISVNNGKRKKTVKTLSKNIFYIFLDPESGITYIIVGCYVLGFMSKRLLIGRNV